MIARTIGYVVNSVLSRIDDHDPKNFERLVNIACEQYAEFGFYHIGRIEVKYIKLPASLIVPFPPDMEDYILIGYVSGGNIRTLTVNDRMAPPRLGVCLNMENPGRGSSLPNSGFYFSDHMHGGQHISAAFASGGGLNRSFYNIDKEQRIIWLSHDLPASELLLQYTSNGTTDGPQTVVMSSAVEPLRRYLLWQIIDLDPETKRSGAMQSLAVKRERQFNDSVIAMRALENSFTMDEYLDSCYREYRQGPKR